MRRFSKTLQKLWRRRQLDGDLEGELRFHLEMKAEESGNREAAQRSVGNVTALKEACRELWSFANLETWWQDIRYALRMLAKTRFHADCCDRCGAGNWRRVIPLHF
jgi:hypothetical protein